jgi:hypothetical protein
VLAQSKINGRVVDDLGNPFSYASVLLLSPTDSLLISGAVSGENGQFHFESVTKSNYLLSVSIVGFNKHFENLKVTTDPIVDIKINRFFGPKILTLRNCTVLTCQFPGF